MYSKLPQKHPGYEIENTHFFRAVILRVPNTQFLFICFSIKCSDGIKTTSWTHLIVLLIPK